MKKSTLQLAVIALGVLLISGCSLKPVMVNEQISPYGVEQTIETIHTNAKAIGWSVPRVMDMNIPIQKHLDTPLQATVRIVELCNPHHAYDILSVEESRYAALFMPCAIAIYTKEDGNTYVASMKAARVGGFLGGNVAQVMTAVEEDQKMMLEFLHTSQ